MYSQQSNHYYLFFQVKFKVTGLTIITVGTYQNFIVKEVSFFYVLI